MMLAVIAIHLQYDFFRWKERICHQEDRFDGEFLTATFRLK